MFLALMFRPEVTHRLERQFRGVGRLVKEERTFTGAFCSPHVRTLTKK